MEAALQFLIYSSGWGVALLLGVVYLRNAQRRHYDRFRRTYVAQFPRDLPHDAVLNFLRALSGLPTPKFLAPVHTVVFDVYADVAGITHYLSIPGHVVADVESLFRTHIAGGSLVKADTDRVAATDWERAGELSTTSVLTPLRIGSAEAVTATILSAFSLLQPDQALLMQWVILPAPRRAVPKEPAEAKNKLAEPTYLAIGRLGARGTDADRLVRRMFTNLSSTDTYGMKFTKRVSLQPLVKKRIRRRSGVLAFPSIFNAAELSVLIGFPAGQPNVAGLPMGRARHLAPDHMIPSEGGVTVGRSSFPGLEDRRLVIPYPALTMHEWLLGGTGTGKSTLLHNQAVDIMQAGHGLILMEPKGDLAWDVLRSVPPERAKDVIWFDPTDIKQPIGFNVLGGPDPERTRGHVVALFHSIYRDSWGARLEQILGYAVLTAALNDLTLYDVKALLVNKDFRERIVRQTHDSEVRTFWRRYASDKDWEPDFDSVINKLDGFLGSRRIRNIVGQTSGLDVSRVVRDHRILLVPLPAATLGEANASMFGSLLVDQIWQNVRLREPSERYPIVLMLDEFQNYLKLSTAMEDVFAEARSYQLGMVVANQHTAQLTDNVRAALRANARTKIVFGMNPDDAKKLHEEFAPLGASDLGALGQFEVAAKIMTVTGPAPVATAHTPKAPPLVSTGAEIIHASRTSWGRPVNEVEAEFAERHKRDVKERKRPQIGRVSE